MEDLCPLRATSRRYTTRETRSIHTIPGRLKAHLRCHQRKANSSALVCERSRQHIHSPSMKKRTRPHHQNPGWTTLSALAPRTTIRLPGQEAARKCLRTIFRGSWFHCEIWGSETHSVILLCCALPMVISRGLLMHWSKWMREMLGPRQASRLP